MGASLWDQVGLPLLIGLASSIVFAALCFLSVRLWNCLMKHIKPQTAAGERAHDQPLPAGDAAAHANGVPDLEMGNGHGPAEGIEHFSDQQAHTPVIESPHTITRDAARGALDRWACRSLKGTSSFPAKPRKRLLNEAPTGRGRLSTYAGHDCSGSMNSVELKPPFGRSASLSSPVGVGVGEVVDDSAAPLTLINPPAG